MCETIQPISQIRYITEFLERHLNRKVLEYSLKDLTKPGDNFGSVIQSLDIRVAERNTSDSVSLQ